MSRTDLIPRDDSSTLALSSVALAAGDALDLHEREHDLLLHFSAGDGVFLLAGESIDVASGSAALVLAGEDAILTAGESGLSLVCATAAVHDDLHAPLGAREVVVRLERAGAERAAGSRSYQVLFGPHNGSNRATLFAGFLPPGGAPLHYHLYDEIVWIPEGPGRLHLSDSETELGPGSAFRLRPRQPHVVENASRDREMTLVAVIAPAGSPSAAYLAE
jgi:quercetin dioxygenase-like cupin family protein